jgi:hypothetical protein
MGIRGLSLGVERPVLEADHSTPSSAEIKECVELYLHFPSTPSWRGAQFKKKAQRLHVYLYLFVHYSSSIGSESCLLPGFLYKYTLTPISSARFGGRHGFHHQGRKNGKLLPVTIVVDT